MTAVTTFGVPLMALGVALLWWSGPDRTHIRHTLAAAGVACVGGLGIGDRQGATFPFKRCRPTRKLLAPIDDDIE
jgi:hypothetical protein